MHPVLRIPLGGGVELGAYSSLYLLAWVVAPLVAAWFARRAGFSFGRAVVVYGGALAAGVVGARLLDLFVAWRFYAEDPGRIWGLTFQGFSLYGGLVLATFVGIALGRLQRLDVWHLADSAVPGLVVGIVLMRVGCFMRGCCFGVECNLPWGVSFPFGSPAWELQLARGHLGLVQALGGAAALPVHPTQLYEMAAAVVLGAVIFAIVRKGAPAGVPFLLFAAGFTAFRMANGFLRERQEVITAPEWFYPLFYTALVAVIVVLIGRRFAAARSERHEGPGRYP